jgi:hypothetical protein
MQKTMLEREIALCPETRCDTNFKAHQQNVKNETVSRR